MTSVLILNHVLEDGRTTQSTTHKMKLPYLFNTALFSIIIAVSVAGADRVNAQATAAPAPAAVPAPAPTPVAPKLDERVTALEAYHTNGDPSAAFAASPHLA